MWVNVQKVSLGIKIVKNLKSLSPLECSIICNRHSAESALVLSTLACRIWSLLALQALSRQTHMRVISEDGRMCYFFAYHHKYLRQHEIRFAKLYIHAIGQSHVVHTRIAK